VNPRFLLAMAIATCLAFPALGNASSPKRKPYADVERWACQVNDGPWLHFRVIEGEMYARRQPWPKGMMEENKIKCIAWIEKTTGEQ
jgi:hypothetical protein